MRKRPRPFRADGGVLIFCGMPRGAARAEAQQSQPQLQPPQTFETSSCSVPFLHMQ